MKRKKSKIGSLKKIGIVLVLSLVLFFSPLTVPKAHATIWAMFVEQQYGEIVNELWLTIKGIVVGMAKQAILKQLNKQVGSMISKGGGSNGAMFITDWKDYLRVKPMQNSNKFINDYISQTLSGRGSSSLYTSSNSEGFGNAGGNYAKQLGENAKKITSERKTPQVTYNSAPSQMFSDGTFNNLNLYLSGINNPWSYNMHIESKYKEEKAQQEKQASTESISGQGFTGKKNDQGKVLTPGITVKDLLSNTNDAPTKTIAAANDIPSVVSSIVTSLVSTALTKGIGSISSQLNKAEKSAGSKTASCQVDPTQSGCQ